MSLHVLKTLLMFSVSMAVVKYGYKYLCSMWAAMLIRCMEGGNRASRYQLLCTYLTNIRTDNHTLLDSHYMCYVWCTQVCMYVLHCLLYTTCTYWLSLSHSSLAAHTLHTSCVVYVCTVQSTVYGTNIVATIHHLTHTHYKRHVSCAE